METNIFLTFKYLTVAALSLLMSFIMPIAPFLLFTVALVVADFFTGVQAARYKGDVLRSGGVKRTVVKISLYFVALLLTEGFNQVFLRRHNIELDITWVTGGFIALTEIKSNFENIAIVTGVDLWSRWADKIPGYFSMKDKTKKDE